MFCSILKTALDYNVTVVDGRKQISRSTYQAIVEALSTELGVDYEVVMVTPMGRETGKPGEMMDKFAHARTMLEKGVSRLLKIYNEIGLDCSNSIWTGHLVLSLLL